MKKYGRMVLVMVLAATGLLALSGCPKKTEVTSIPETPKETAAAPAASDADTVRKSEQSAPAEDRKEAAAASKDGLIPVYFDFDKSDIREDSKAVLRANAEWLKTRSGTVIRIEGNCDERGTIEYNQALGQRRAAAVRKYLADLGISNKRISLISYGKEKPACTENNENCWQKNRRDDFTIISGKK
jgi:peptidoglycan-associated lipoprotein